jgi:outer membrane protein
MTEFIFKRVTILSLLVIALTGFTAKAQEKITLQMAVDRALANNLTIKQAQVNEEISTVDLKQAKYNLLPSVYASPDAGYSFGKSQVAGNFAFSNSAAFNVNAQASMQVTLFQGGQLKNQIIQNKIFVDVSKSNTAKIKNDLILNVVITYLQILTNQDLVVAAKQQIDLANQILNRSQISFNAGNQTLADLSQAKAQVSTATLNLTTAQNQLDLSILVLKQYMEMNPNTNIEVEKPDISKLTNVQTLYDANEVVTTALGINPDVRLAETQQKTYEQAIKIAQGNYFPVLALTGALNTSYSNQAKNLTLDPIAFGTQFNNNFRQYVGLSLQVPIFNRFNARTSVTKAKLNLDNARLSTQIAKNNLSKTIIQATLDLQAADKQYQSATQTFEANKEALNVTKQRYDVGLVNSLDYNTAVTNYNKSQNDMIAAQYTVIFRSKIIDYYLGKTITL